MSFANLIPWNVIESKLNIIQPVEGGFSLAKRGIITLENGTRVFVKIGLQDNTKKWAKKEIDTYRFLLGKGYRYIPKLLSVNNDETGFAIEVFEHKDGWDWKDNWSYARLDKTLDAMDGLARIKVDDEQKSLFSEKSLSTTDNGWEKLLISPELQERLKNKLVSMGRQDIFRRIDFDVDARNSAKYCFSDDSLVHNDIRSDNCAWNQDLKEVKLVDWNWIQIGDRKIDLAATLTHVYQHGLELVPDYIDRLDTDALHWCAGFWLHAGATPIWDGGSENLRVLQMSSGIAALDLRAIVIKHASKLTQ